MKQIYTHFTTVIGDTTLTYGALYFGIACALFVLAAIGYSMLKDQYKRQ